MGKVPDNVKTPEHIARTCKNCGYSWQEKPVDGEARDNIVDHMINVVAASLDMSREELLKPFPRADAPVIEVGDVVNLPDFVPHCDKAECQVSRMDDTRASLFRINDSNICGCNQLIGNLTIIRKGPKVEKYLGIVGTDIAVYENGTQVSVIEIDKNKIHTLTLTEEATK